MQIPKDISGYLEDYVDGVLSQEGCDTIVSWFHASDENARQFTQWFVWQAQLRDTERLANMQDVFSNNALFGFAAPSAPSGIDARRSTLRPAAYERPTMSVALVACMLLVVGAIAWYAGTRSNLIGEAAPAGTDRDSNAANIPKGSPPETSVPLNETQATAAYVGRLTDCVWGGAELTEGDQLAAGSQIQLESGRAELVFGAGARVSARGPCRMTIEDEHTFNLGVGDVSVEASFGFKVITPSGVVIDLGTAFGVSVDNRGGSEVHVFEGEVAFQPTSPGDNPKKSIVLLKDQACRYSVAGVTLDQFQANEAKFAWRRRELLAPEAVPDLPVRENLVLWLAADRFVETDNNGRVACWRDLIVDANTYPEDALQPAAKYRPLLTRQGLNGHPSIRFGGAGSFLLTPPLYTTNEQTALVVVAMNATDPTFQQILNYNGPPQRIVSPMGGSITPAVFQIFLDDKNRDGKFAVKGHLFSGFTNGRRKSLVSEIVAHDLAVPHNAMVVCFRHSYDAGDMTLFTNGDIAASAHTDNHIAITSRKIIGRHPIIDTRAGVLEGDIGEVLIYNRALPDDEVKQVSNYLMQRFDLNP